MSRRRRRHGGNWTPFALMGLAALFGLFGGRRGPAFDAREVAPPFKPVLTIVALVGAFIGLGVLLTVLSAVAALGGGGVLAVACGVPALFIAFLAWVISQRPKRAQVVGEAEPWDYEGTAREAAQEGRAASAERVESTDAPVSSTATAEPRMTPPAQPFAQKREPVREPLRRSAAPKPAPIPERPPRSPAEYRQRAISYRRKIQSLIKMRRPGPIAERMTGVLEKLKSWEERVGQLADRLTLYERDDLIQRDVREVPGHIERLRRQSALEADPDMQRQVQRTLAAYEEQQRQLELLAKVMKRTRLNLDDTLAAMGTVYSQLQVLNAMDIDGSVATRIVADVDREVERLNDLLQAMADVYSQSAETPQPEQARGVAGRDVADEDSGLPSRKARLGGNATS